MVMCEGMSQDDNFLQYFELGEVSLKDLKGGIYNGPKNDQTALWNTKGRTTAVAIFAIGQPRQALEVSVASLPRLSNRG